MSFNWTSEAVIAAAAFVVTTVGGVGTMAMHWGAVNTTVAEVKAHQDVQDRKIEETDKGLDTQKQVSAGVAAQLAAITKQLDRIEKKL